MINIQKLPLGKSDFKSLRQDGFYYVDKSLFIKEIIESYADVLLIPRPRRFGKTLNLSMLQYFFEKTDDNRDELFKKLAITKEDVYKMHHAKYPVIFLTFKDIKKQNWHECLMSMKDTIIEQYSRFRFLSESDILYPEEKTYFQNILSKQGQITDYESSLKNLSGFLNRYYTQRAVILIDEYDTPIHNGYNKGYYEDVINFMRNFLSGGLKDNVHLFKGVLTGILRVAKESIFSGLNNLGVYSLLDLKFSKMFGFTENEVLSFLNDYNMPDKYEEISQWYNGYQFGNTTIYNPWSVLGYIDNQGIAKPYWVNTASTEVIDTMATRGGKELREEIGVLLEGRVITKPIFESIVMRELERRDDLFWSFLLFSGYLKALDRLEDEHYTLQIPNQEVRTIYRNLVQTWFNEKIESNKVEQLLTALTDGNIEVFEYILAETVEKVLSYHDTAGAEPEKFYHAFTLGLLIWLSGDYEIKSNRESGFGRYDVVLIPKNKRKNGIIMEFKKVNKRKNETPEQTLENALKQIEDRKYAVELESAGIKNIIKLAVAFEGKALWIKQG